VPEIELRRLPGETPGVAAGEIVLKNFPVEGSVRVEMRARTAKGTVEHSVATRGEVTPFSVNVPAPALSIELDPDQRILRWTEAARRSKARSEVLAALPEPITRKNLASAIEVYRRALAADPDDASQRAQGLHERLGELLYAHDEWDAALAELEAATNGHSIEPFETYLCRGKAYLYRGSVQLHLQRPRAALEDARAGLDLPLPVLEQAVPREPVESKGRATLRQLLERLEKAARGS
jgi:tetratricopeptide (TPR) repeat protein